jgi:hypothetical protein
MPQPYIVVDSLHLTHCVRPGVVQWSDVAAFDATLARLGGKLLFLRVSAETVWQRLFENPRRTAFRDGYARRFGKTPEDALHHFLVEQDRMGTLYDASSLRKQVVDADQPLMHYLETVIQFWDSD